MDDFCSEIRDSAELAIRNNEPDNTTGESGLLREISQKPPFGESLYLEDIGEYRLYLGIPEDQIQTIIDFSQDGDDKALQNNTGDQKRFSSYDQCSSWYYYP